MIVVHRNKNISFLLTLLLIFSASCKKHPITWSEVLVRGPYLQMPGPTEVTLKWRTSIPIESVVKYGTSPTDLSKSVVLEDPSGDHRVKISGLEPSTKYYYSIGTFEKTLQGDTDNYFITAPPEGKIKKTRIWAIGDAGTGKPEQNMVRDAFLKYTNEIPTDVWLWLGDNAYQNGTDKQYQQNVFSNRFENILKNTAAWPVIGNHDFAQKGYQSFISKTFPFPYYRIFTLPENGELGGAPSGTENYYSFNYSNIHFVALDSYASYNNPSSDMYQWLKKDLSSNTQKWIVVYFHHPPYSKGSHDSDTEKEMVDMRQNIVPLLEHYGADLVLSGHSHVYERSFLLNGHYGTESSLSKDMILNKNSGTLPEPYLKKGPDYKGTVYVVAGASGQAGGSHAGWPHAAMYYANNTDPGSLVIDIDGDVLTAKYLNLKGRIMDEFSIYKPQEE